MTSPLLTLNLPAPPQGVSKLRLGRLYGAARSLAVAELCLQHPGVSLVITDTIADATRLELELKFYFKGTQYPLHIFPDWETLPYDHFSPHQDIVSQRLLTLYELPQLKRGAVIVAARTLLHRLPPPEYIRQYVFQLGAGQQVDTAQFREQMIAGGYRHVAQVMEHGEFAVRGSILDIFPMGSTRPYRLDLFDREIESIRDFDPATQRSGAKLESVRLLPAREFPLDESGITAFRNRYRNRFEGNPQANPVYKDISQGIAAAGAEYYLPLFFDSTRNLFDYLPAGELVIAPGDIEHAAAAFHSEVATRHESFAHDIERPILKPEELYLSPAQLAAELTRRPQASVRPFALEGQAGSDGQINCETRQPPALQLNPRAEQPSLALQRFIEDFGGRILFVCESAGRREALLQLLHNIDVHPLAHESWQGFLSSRERLGIIIGALEQGVLIGSQLALIDEAQIFGERVQQRRRRRDRQARDIEAIIGSLTDLHIGAPVVHEYHGIGRYQGLQTLEIGGIATEFLALEYADGDKLFVPVASLDLISRYTGASPESAPLHKLGGEQWQKIRRKAAQRVRDIAAELLDLYARRAARRGHAFKPGENELSAFAAQFPFEETPDQQAAIDSVIQDMTSGTPMDRVVCGDVGFGKTEVAMRATFAALQDAKQVAILVPTTLLAQQHYQNFSDRFADWQYRIESLSRFSSSKEQQQLLQNLADGKVDVVIGTHRLLQKDVRFRDLGLVIVDEEHRFGVTHKERLKSLRAEVDVLTLTATPIPRTLNMAISGLRDLSIIATPPPRRNAIRTFIIEWNDQYIIEACQRELKRGGQIYFVHNEVHSIARIAGELTKLLPEARLAIAHGQLPERELEKIMSDFYHQRYNILLCTTIIESGIDIPTANTIIINRADKFGLAQLHQLRGRVGRSHHHAYAYLLTPPIAGVTADAKKRLEAIASLEDLGAGFSLASHDLEIRGAGELLGDEQSGQIQEIGYTLYTEMLEKAVKALKSGQEPALEQPLHDSLEIDLAAPALLPQDYIYDVHTRLVLYKRIANAASGEELNELQVELIDRFGLLPEPAKNLFGIAGLKFEVRAAGIRRVKTDAHGNGFIEFAENPDIAIERLIKLIQTEPALYKFDGKQKLNFKPRGASTLEARIKFVSQLIRHLRNKKAA
ncbi:MAG TPA: transcription-repair coupling factor [Gammaproteobacteria bacterium]|nr:transcription-repair coupling factor [Gammaproteobacteria bacterium]